MHVGFDLQFLTPACPASQRPRSTSWSQVLFFFFFIPLHNKGKKEKPQKQKKQEHRKVSRDDSQGSAHCLVSVGHAAMETQGAAAPCRATQPGMRGWVGPGSYSGSIASSDCSGGIRGGEPGAGAPQLSTRGPPFTRALPPPPRGLARGPGGCLRCLAS